MEQNVSVTVSVGDLLSMNYSEDLFDAITFDETDGSFFESNYDHRDLSPSFAVLFDMPEPESSFSPHQLTSVNSDGSETEETDQSDDDYETINVSNSAATKVHQINKGAFSDDDRLLSELESVLSSKTNAIARFLRSLELSLADLLALCKQYPTLLAETTHKKRAKYGHRRRLTVSEKRTLVKDRNREHSHNLRVRRKLYEQIRMQIGKKHHDTL